MWQQFQQGQSSPAIPWPDHRGCLCLLHAVKCCPLLSVSLWHSHPHSFCFGGGSSRDPFYASPWHLIQKSLSSPGPRGSRGGSSSEEPAQLHPHCRGSTSLPVASQRRNEWSGCVCHRAQPVLPAPKSSAYTWGVVPLEL